MVSLSDYVIYWVTYCDMKYLNTLKVLVKPYIW